MILDTPCALRSSSSTRSRNGRVPAFELLRRPTTRPSSVGTRLANGTAFPVTAPTGASNSIVAMSVPPVERLAPGEDNIRESTSRLPPGLQDREGGLAAQHIVLGRIPARDADGADDGDAVEKYEPAGRGEQAPAMRDEEAFQPGLAGLSRHVGGGEVKRGRRVGLVDGELCRQRGGAIHPTDGDGHAR